MTSMKDYNYFKDIIVTLDEGILIEDLNLDKSPKPNESKWRVLSTL